MMRRFRARAALVVAVTLLIPSFAAMGSAGAGGRDRNLWELLGGTYSRGYQPVEIRDDPASGPSNWQTRMPAPDAIPQVDLKALEVSRVLVDPEILGRIPVPGLSTLPADPGVIAPAGQIADPATYREVLQVDLLLGAPLDQLPPGQGIGLAVLRSVEGQAAFNAPGTQFHQASVADRFVSGQGLTRLAVNPASGRFEPTASDTLLFLDGDRARFWIPWPAAAGTTAIQGHPFVPNTQIADTSTGEPGTGTVLTVLDPATLDAARLDPQVVRTETPTESPVVNTTSDSGGTSMFVWVLVLGVVVLLFALALYVVPTLVAGPGGDALVAAPAGDDPRDDRPKRKRRRRRKHEEVTQIDPPRIETWAVPDTTTEPSVLQYVGEEMVVGDILTATGRATPTKDREPPEVGLPTTETPEVPTTLPFDEVLPGPPSTLVTGDTALEVPRVTPCEPERVAWTTAQRACDQARFDAAAAEADAADARAELDRMRSEYPPLDWQGTGGLDATMDTGEHVTDLDMRLGDFAASRAGGPSLPPGATRAEQSRRTREEARREYDDMQAKAAPLRDRIRKAEEARRRAEEVCAQADAARRAYEQCMGTWSQRAPKPANAPPPDPGPTPAPVGAGSAPTPPPRAKAPTPPAPPTREPPRVTSSPGPGVASSAPPPPPGGCTQDKVTEVCPRQKFRVGRTLHLEIRGTAFRNDWDSVAAGFAQWAGSLGYGYSDGETVTTGMPAVEVAGEDVPRLLGRGMWHNFLTGSYEIEAWVRFEEVTMACERRWPCVNGTYGSPITTTRRIRQDRFTSGSKTLGNLRDKSNTVDREELLRFLHDVWKEFGDGQAELDAWVGRCH